MRTPHGVRTTEYRSPPIRASASAARYTAASHSGPTRSGTGFSSARWAASAIDSALVSFCSRRSSE